MLCAVLASAISYAQDTVSTYQLDLLKVAYLNKEDKRAVGALFVVKPTDMRYFPPVLSMGVGYALNGDTVFHRVDIQNDPMRRVQIEIYGKDMPTKAPMLFALVKDKIDLEAYEDMLFLFFRLRNISEVAVNEITLEYGLWEKDNLDRRIERRFVAIVGE